MTPIYILGGMQRWEDQSKLVLLGPNGAGWPATEKGLQMKQIAEEDEARLER